MRALITLAAAGLAAATHVLAAGPAEPQTVCTVTVNSADEKASFRRHLPPARYRFVELVEPGRADWLASACRADIRCDVLIVSGHYDGSSVFFSDRLDASEHLPVAELERVSCSESCSGVFAQLKEVYLFGCNTLNPQALNSASAETVRGIVREGRTPVQAERLLQAIQARQGQSSRDRMRLVFKDTPVIYGFSAAAPLGPTAASVLDRYFQSAGASEVGRGRRSASLLAQFAPQAMTAASGLGEGDPLTAMRADMCRFADERQSPAQKLGFVHQVLQRQTVQLRPFLDPIEQVLATLDAATRNQPEVDRMLGVIARDMGARGRFLDFARDHAEPALRARLLALAQQLGWLSHAAWRDERVHLLEQLLALRSIGVDEVELTCTLNQGGTLDGALDRHVIPTGHEDEVGRAAMQACLGHAGARQRVLQALASPQESDLRIAQALLRQRPFASTDELHRVTALVAAMDQPDAQVRALDALARQRLHDATSLGRLLQLYERTTAAAVQNAVAGVLIRADLGSLEEPPLLQRRLRAHRIESAPGQQPLLDLLLSTQAAP